MRLELAAIHGGIPHASVVRLHIHFGPDAAFEAFFSAALHLHPQGQILLRSVGPVLALGSLERDDECKTCTVAVVVQYVVHNMSSCYEFMF